MQMWFVLKSGTVIGPLSSDRVASSYNSPGVMVWGDVCADWLSFTEWEHKYNQGEFNSPQEIKRTLIKTSVSEEKTPDKQFKVRPELSIVNKVRNNSSLDSGEPKEILNTDNEKTAVNAPLPQIPQVDDIFPNDEPLSVMQPLQPLQDQESPSSEVLNDRLNDLLQDQFIDDHGQTLIQATMDDLSHELAASLPANPSFPGLNVSSDSTQIQNLNVVDGATKVQNLDLEDGPTKVQSLPEDSTKVQSFSLDDGSTKVQNLDLDNGSTKVQDLSLADGPTKIQSADNDISLDFNDLSASSSSGSDDLFNFDNLSLNSDSSDSNAGEFFDPNSILDEQNSAETSTEFSPTMESFEGSNSLADDNLLSLENAFQASDSDVDPVGVEAAQDSTESTYDLSDALNGGFQEQSGVHGDVIGIKEIVALPAFPVTSTDNSQHNEAKAKVTALKEAAQNIEQSKALEKPIWYLAYEGKSEGPMNVEALLKKLDEFKSPEFIYLWKKGFPDWLNLYDTPQISSQLGIGFRRHDRFPFTGTVKIEFNGNIQIGQLENLSFSGLGATGFGPLVLGETVKVTLDCPALNREVEFVAKIRFSSDLGVLGLSYIKTEFTENINLLIELVKEASAQKAA